MYREGLKRVYTKLNLRPIRTRHLSQTINNFVWLWPGKSGRVVCRPRVEVCRRRVENKVTIALEILKVNFEILSAQRSGLETMCSYRREAFSINHDSMKQLAKDEGLCHPTSEPPRSLTLGSSTSLVAPNEPFLLT
jgi:hypothetical protein